MRRWAGLVDLVLPAECAGCGGEQVALRYGTCAACVAELEALEPGSTRPSPVPAGFPPCTALGPYDGVLRDVLLAYKERGRHGLAVPLGGLLADVIASALGGAPLGVLLIPVPATARAARARHGDHMVRLARQAADRLRLAGWPAVVAQPLRALPRPDSAELDAGRAEAAETAFRMRAGRAPALRRAAAGRSVVLLDDIVTTGVTLAATASALAAVDVPAHGAAVLAATRLRYGQ